MHSPHPNHGEAFDLLDFGRLMFASNLPAGNGMMGRADIAHYAVARSHALMPGAPLVEAAIQTSTHHQRPGVNVSRGIESRGVASRATRRQGAVACACTCSLPPLRFACWRISFASACACDD